MKDDNTWLVIFCLALVGFCIIMSGSCNVEGTRDPDGAINLEQYTYSYGIEYTVQENDSLYSIIEKYREQGKDVNKETLVAINNLTLYYDELGNEWCDIHPGMELVIPIE